MTQSEEVMLLMKQRGGEKEKKDTPLKTNKTKKPKEIMQSDSDTHLQLERFAKGFSTEATQVCEVVQVLGAHMCHQVVHLSAAMHTDGTLVGTPTCMNTFVGIQVELRAKCLVADITLEGFDGLQAKCSSFGYWLRSFSYWFTDVKTSEVCVPTCMPVCVCDEMSISLALDPTFGIHSQKTLDTVIF